ncbi:unnamed protein product [Caenorhabditis angaria]|uniref:Uncharacterized protein n=1 Tax=Caenorhabditis angaria TaxID=860376 RepID=A0A9P1I7V4_9PELO|nr:unnamed protein product [Caenorhabditis angaria]
MKGYRSWKSDYLKSVVRKHVYRDKISAKFENSKSQSISKSMQILFEEDEMYETYPRSEKLLESLEALQTFSNSSQYFEGGLNYERRHFRWVKDQKGIEFITKYDALGWFYQKKMSEFLDNYAKNGKIYVKRKILSKSLSEIINNVVMSDKKFMKLCANLEGSKFSEKNIGEFGV